MYEIHNLMYFYHRIYPASGPSRKCNEPILYYSACVLCVRVSVQNGFIRVVLNDLGLCRR